MANNDEQAKLSPYEKVVQARQTLNESIEMQQNLGNVDDQLTALKTGYQLATKLVPDKIKRSLKLYLINDDDYIDMLNRQRLHNYNTICSKKRDQLLAKREQAVVQFKKDSLVHGQVWIDNLIVLDQKQRIIKITAVDFLTYIKPYQTYLQKEYEKLRPKLNIKTEKPD